MNNYICNPTQKSVLKELPYDLNGDWRKLSVEVKKYARKQNEALIITLCPILGPQGLLGGL